MTNEDYSDKKAYLRNKLNNIFKDIPRSEMVQKDFDNFKVNQFCDVFLKYKIIEKYDQLSDKTKDFRNLFGPLTFKQAYVTTYFEGKTPRCPFCGQLLEIYEIEDTENEDYKNENGCYKKYKYVVADIEHIIPKSIFPQLALHPNNMVPCCKECNQSIKKDNFFARDEFYKFEKAIKDLNLDMNNLHPLELWKFYKLSFDCESLNIIINKNYSKEAKGFLNFYGIKNRIEIVASRCYDILFNIIRHSDIRSPESLERLLENMASSNWHEINDGYSLNNSPQIWQEFIENILYDECKLMALWDEVKSMYMSIF